MRSFGKKNGDNYCDIIELLIWFLMGMGELGTKLGELGVTLGKICIHLILSDIQIFVVVVMGDINFDMEVQNLI